MYAFLSKVFGRKKDDKEDSSLSQPVLGPGELLGGRFEAVSPPVSPTTPFLELEPKTNEEAKVKEKEKDLGFSFFKGKWRPASPAVRPTRKLDVLPHLSLNFQEPQAITPDLKLLFTTDQILSDAVIGQRRLNPLEALVLVQACSQAIIVKGLETLGIMHPHWYAASHEIQRRVISHFIYLSNLENAASTSLPASPTSPVSAFEAEVNDTFSPHDIAAILRWSLRHFQIEGDSFGTDDGWYKAFLEAEGAAGYPPKAFSDKLAPLLPTAHLRLLTATLEIFSSLAAHAEVNGTSGSKLCKIFGFWLLTAHRIEDKDDWKTFYARWERTGRMLEHLFLSRIRDQSAHQRMPIRLLELVRKYPYTKGLSSPTTDLPLLPRPPFTTRLHNAFFVRIETELPYGRRKPNSKLHPLSFLADAFSTKVEEGEYADLWTKITTASKDGNSSSLCNIFTDDTIRFLSLVPDEPVGHEVRLATSSVVSPASTHKRLTSIDDADKSDATVARHPKLATEPSSLTPLSPLTNTIGSDWAQFSTSGFLEVNPNIIPLASTLLDTDIEKTTPPEPIVPLSRKSSKRSKAASPSSPRKSVDLARSGTEASEAKPEDIEEQKNIFKASELQIVQLDEAFFDFWSDSLLDPISNDWPTFIICKFKPSLVPKLTFGVAEEGKKRKTIQWLVLEQVYTIRTPPVLSIPINTVRQRPSSPGSRPSSAKKRFSFWSVSKTASGSSGTSLKSKKKDQELKVDEMGELVEEEPKDDETKEPTAKVKSPIFRPRKSLDIAQKPIEGAKKSVIKSAEEAKIDEETATVTAVATGVVVASTAAVIANGLSTDEPRLVEAVTAKAEDTPAVSTPVAVAETVVPSLEPTVKNDDTSLPTAVPEVVSSPEVKMEAEPLESVVESSPVATDAEAAGIHPESELQPKLTETEPALLAAEGTVITNESTDRQDKSMPLHSVLESEVTVVEDVVETEDQVKTDPISATQGFTVVESDVPSVTDTPPTTAEAPSGMVEVEETASVLAQHEPIVVAPLVSEVTILEPEIETEASVKLDSTTEESPAAVLASELETSQVIGVASVAIDHTESETQDAVSQPQTVELESKLEPKAIEAEPIFSPVEEPTVNVAIDKTNGSAPVHAVDQYPHQVAVQEEVTEGTLGDREDEVEVITAAPAKLEGFSTAEDVEAKDTVVEEVIEHEPETAHPDEPATMAEDSSEMELDKDAPVSLELQSQLEQQILTVSSTTQETEVDAASKDAVVAHEVEDEVTAKTHETDALIVAPTTANDLVVAETEQPVIPPTDAKQDFASSPVFHDVTNVEPEAVAEPIPAPIEEAFSTSIEHESETAHSDEPATIVEGSPEIVLAPVSPELQSDLDQETLMVSSTTAEETGAVVAREVEAEIAAETHGTEDTPTAAPTTANDPVAVETEQPVMPATETKHDFFSPALHDATNVEPEVETEAFAEPVPASIEQDFPTHIEHEPETIHSDEPAIIVDAPIPPELQSELEQETLSATVEVDAASRDVSTAALARDVEAEVSAETHETEALITVPTTANDLDAAESTETEQPVMLVTEGGSTKDVNEAFGEAVGLPITEDFSSMDEVELGITHEVAPDVGNESVESGTAPAPAAEDTILDIPMSLRNDPTPVLEPEVEADIQVEAASMPTIESTPIDVEVQSEPPSFVETAPNVQKDIEVETQVDDSSNVKDEPVSESDIVHHNEDESRTEESQITAVLEPEVDFVAPAEEEPSVNTPVEAENLSPGFESEVVISQSPIETIPIPEDETASVVNAEGQIVEPVDSSSEHTALVETARTDELVEVNLPSVEESPEALAPIVESYDNSPDDDMVKSHIIPEADTVVPETQVLDEGALVPTTEEPAAPVELNLEQEAAANVSVHSQELPVVPETEQSVTHEEVAHSSDFSAGHQILPISDAVETEPEPLSTNTVSEHKVSTREVEDQIPSECRNTTTVESKDEIVPLATAESEPEALTAVVAPVSGTLELQAQHSVEETTEEVYGTVEAPSATEAEVAIPIEDRSVLAVEVLPTDSPSTADPSVEETSVISESTTVPLAVPEDIQIENDGIAQAEEDLADLPTDNLVHEGATRLVESEEAVEETLPVIVSEPATAVVEDLQVENGGAAQAEEHLLPTDNPVQEELVTPLVEPKEVVEMPSTVEPSAADIATVVSEPSAEVPTDLSTDSDGIIQARAEEYPPPTDSPLQEEAVTPSVELKQAVEMSSIDGPSVAETLPVVISEPAIVVPEIENSGIVQAEEYPPPPTDTPIQKEAAAPLVELKEAVEVSSSTVEPSAAEIATVVSEPPAIFTSDLEISQATEMAPAAVGHSPLAESESQDSVSQPQAMELESKLEPKAIEAEHTFSPVEEPTVDVAIGEKDDSAPNDTVDQFSHEVAVQEIADDALDDKADRVEVITASTNVEEFGAAEDVEAKDTIVKEAKYDFVSSPALHDNTNLEPDVQTEASAEPVPASIEQDFPTNIEREPETAHSNEPSAIVAGSSTALDENAPVSPELQLELEQELSATAQETGVDVVSKDASTTVVTHEVEAIESTGTEPPIMPATEGDSTKHMNEEGLGLSTAEDSSSMDEVEPDVTHEVIPDAANGSVESRIIETQCEHEVDITVPAVEDTIPDIPASLHKDPTPTPSLLEPEMEAEIQVEAASIPTIESTSIDVEVQPEHPGLIETAPSAEKDIEVETRVDDSSNVKDEPIPESDITHHIEVADTEGSLEDTSSTKESQTTAKLEPEVDFVGPAEGSDIDQGNALSTQTEYPTMEQVERDAQIESIEPAAQETTVSEETNPEELSATIEDFNDHSDINSSSVEPSAGVEPIEENPVNEIIASSPELPAEVIQEPTSLKVDDITPPEFQDVDAAVPVTITDVSSTVESSAIEGPQVEPEAKEIASDRLEDSPQTDIMAADETIPSTRDCETDAGATKEPSQSTSVLLELPTEQPEVLECIESSTIESSINAAETETGQTSASTEPSTKPEDFVENPEMEGISETHSQVNFTDVQVLPEAKDKPVHDLVEPVDSHAEVEESVEISSTADPSVAETSVTSEPTPVPLAVPEDIQIENDGIAQAEEDLVDPPADDSAQEEAIAPLVEFKEAAEMSSTVEPSIVETLSEPTTVVPEDLQIENGGIAQAEEYLPPADNPVQEEDVAPLVESKAVEPSVAEVATVVSEPATLVPEDLQIEDGGIAHAEEYPPPPIDNPVQEESVAPLVECEETTEVSSTVEQSAAEIATEPSTEVPEDLQVENGGIVQAEEYPPLPNDNVVQGEAVAPLIEFKEAAEMSSTVEPSVAEPASVVFEPSTEVPEDLSVDSDGITQAEDDLVDLPAPPGTFETEPVGERSEAAIPETIAVEDMTALSQVETQSFDEAKVEAPETHVSNGNEYSATTQETIGTHEATSEDLTTEEDNIKAEPKVIEPIHYPDISPTTLEAPSTTD